jgi:predicted HAD superfamily Cof-like phosphohydrolase
MNIWDQVKEFHKAFRLPIFNRPYLRPFMNGEQFELHLKACQQALEQAAVFEEANCQRSLRIKLLLEEVAEYIEAERRSDIIEIADALTDIHYIAAGTSVAYGIPGKDIFDHVHENNMTKLGEDGDPIYREDGKVLKPEGYVPPDVAQFLVNIED